MFHLVLWRLHFKRWYSVYAVANLLWRLSIPFMSIAAAHEIP